ncbi:MAG: ATP-binding cassette domain-containing protein [Christensenellales bacterium]
MIKLNNLDKYYYKNKSNEIHVIDNTSLEFPETGLVALLGKSGSGKTTLLNVIGGLDSFDKGSIEIDGTVLNRYNPKVIDAMRSKKIGYIFQNYYLLNDKTVYENLEISLKLAGFSDKERIDKRIDYALSLVGLLKYKKRTPNTLSGGQQQRVGIARALVKGASVIIADEPTGNLDSDNTFEVMDLLKGISKSCLVILVTHEEDIANFFADRIIRIRDGRVYEDYINDSVMNLTVQDNKKIFLKDLKYNETLSLDNVTINYNGDRKSKFEINIIEKDGRLFIDSFNTSMPVTLIDDKSEVRVVDAHFEEKKKGQHESVNVDREILSETNATSGKSVINTASVFKKAWISYLRKPFRKKMPSHMILFLTAAVITVIVAFLNMFLVFNESNYLNNRNTVNMLMADSADYTVYEGKHGIEKVCLSYGSIYFTPFFNSNAENYRSHIDNVTIFPADVLDDPKIVKGRMPESPYEAVVDVKTYKKRADAIKSYGNENNYEFLIGEELHVSNNVFIICGIIDSGYHGAWIDGGTLYDILDNNRIGKILLLYDKEEFSEWAKQQGITYLDEYEWLKKDFQTIRGTLLYTLTGVIIAAIAFMFGIASHSVKTNFINNIKVIGTYRCIGVKKSELLKEFVFENLITLTFSSLIGVIIAGFILYIIKPLYDDDVFSLNINALLFIIVTALIYSVNIGFTALKVYSLLRLTPAEIMAKYDI